MKHAYLAWIEYLIGNSGNLIGVFSTPELAQAACLEHYQKENFTTKDLDWARARNIVYHAVANVGSYRYAVRQEVVDPVITYPAHESKPTNDSDYTVARGILAPATEPAEVSIRRLRDSE